MYLYTIIILVQSLLILLWVSFVKTRNNEVPDFDHWLYAKMKYNPSLNLESAFNEYILTFNILVLQDQNESEHIARSRAKLKLIEEYNIDSMLQDNQHFHSYKQRLQSMA